MSRSLRDWTESLLHLFFPHSCTSCGVDLPRHSPPLCIRCHSRLPYTDFTGHADNPVEKIFWGRLPIRNACSIFYFTKNSMLQHLLHQLKYMGNQDLGISFGQLMGHSILRADRFSHIDVLIPLPLHHQREKKRGYNQSLLLCKGMQRVMKTPVDPGLLIRNKATATQTHKSRSERWSTMQDKFRCTNASRLKGKRVALVDDVITTGSTLEACGREIIRSGATSLDIITMAYTLR